MLCMQFSKHIIQPIRLYNEENYVYSEYSLIRSATALSAKPFNLPQFLSTNII